jgi:hypothetical protein
MTKLLVLLLVMLSMTSCTNKTETIRVLEMNGYTNVQTHGFSWFGCSKGDYFSTKFTATINNKPVSGVVCSGWFKGSTIRF